MSDVVEFIWNVVLGLFGVAIGSLFVLVIALVVLGVRDEVRKRDRK